MGDEATSGQAFQWALTNGDIDQVKTCINEVNNVMIAQELPCTLTLTLYSLSLIDRTAFTFSDAHSIACG